MQSAAITPLTALRGESVRSGGFMPRPENPVPDCIRPAADDFTDEALSGSSSSESPLFLDETDAHSSATAVDSPLLVETNSPLFHSAPPLIIGPHGYRRRDGSAVRATRRALDSVTRAGQHVVHSFRRTGGLIGDQGRGAFQRVQAFVRTCRNRLPNRSDTASFFVRPGGRARGTIADAVVATLVLAVLAYVARPAPSPTQVAPTAASRADVGGVVSRQATSASLASDALTAVSHASAATPVATSARSSKVIPKPAAARPTAAAVAPFVGALRVTSQPQGAEVSLNGVHQGRTPLTIRRVRAGSRVVSLFLPGYERWSWSVAVVADRETPLAVKLQADHAAGSSHPE
jgi:PEGA domain